MLQSIVKLRQALLPLHMQILDDLTANGYTGSRYAHNLAQVIAGSQCLPWKLAALQSPLHVLNDVPLCPHPWLKGPAGKVGHRNLCMAQPF
jgi:hypothetical protein